MGSVIRTTILIASLAASVPAAQEPVPPDLPLLLPEDRTHQPDEERAEHDLESFVTANIQVSDIAAEYERRIGREGMDLETAAALQREANDRVERAIERAGLTIESYVAVVEAIEEDPGLRAEVSRMIYDRKQVADGG